MVPPLAGEGAEDGAEDGAVEGAAEGGGIGDKASGFAVGPMVSRSSPVLSHDNPCSLMVMSRLALTTAGEAVAGVTG